MGRRTKGGRKATGRRLCWWILLLAGVVPVSSQGQVSTGPQQLALAGLRSVRTGGLPAGQINALMTDRQRNVFLLIDQQDGVRLLKTDPAGAAVLAQAQIGAKGDTGLAMCLDPAGNVYVTGTTASGALTATAGAAFLTATGSGTNGFVAKFDTNLNTYFVSFAGANTIYPGAIAATGEAVFIAGSIFSATLPVTSAGVIQAPAYGTTGNGFVERFSASGNALAYATYLSGAGGSTSIAALAADSADSAYVAGYTNAPGFPTVAALVPEMIGTTSGFVTKLTPGGDGITFSTFVPGGGITSLAIDGTAGNLLLSGSVALGQFPVATVAGPLAPLNYQVLIRMALDGSAVVASSVLAPGSGSYVGVGSGGTAWVAGDLALPLLPQTPVSTVGNSYAMRVEASGAVDQTARFGGVAEANAAYASAPVNLTSVAVDLSGAAWVGGVFAPSASASLLTAETFDLPLENAPTTALPTEVHGAVLPASACSGSLCPGAAAYLAKVLTPAAGAVQAALALSIDDAPTLTLRNLSTAPAAGVQIAVNGFAETDNCGTIAAGGECSIALIGSGPGSITVSAANAQTQTRAIATIPGTVLPATVVFSPKELDFGIVSAAGAPATRTVTATNLTQTSQTFASMMGGNMRTAPPYTFSEQSTDCTLAGGTNRVLAPGSSCHITLSLAASGNAADDGAIRANWMIGGRSVALTAYGQAAGLAVSAAELDFGTQYTGGLRAPRYLYLSNTSGESYNHATVTLPPDSPFTVTDGCPSVLAPATICRMGIRYEAAKAPSVDAITLTLDQGLTVLVTGQTQAQPTATGATVNPNLSVSTTALAFPVAVPVTAVSSATETLTITNTGVAAFGLGLALTGDFSQTTNCGSSLAGGASCTLVFRFAPSAPGTRNGLLSVTAGAGSEPANVTLTGMATAILSPATNGAIDLGTEPVGQPVTVWYKVTQSFSSFAAATSSATLGSPFRAVLVEDIGYGHGQPAPAAFSTSATGTCFNCWVGLQFNPVSAGLETGTLTLSSAGGGNPYVLSLTGTGTSLAGLTVSPTAQDFGTVAVNSTSAAQQFVVTNLLASQAAASLGTPAATGNFAISSAPTGGAPCGGTLAYGATCTVQVFFAPTATGERTGSLSITAGSSTLSAALTGYGAPDPGIALSPTALVFANTPGLAAVQQTVTLTNTSSAAVAIASPVVTPSGGGTSFSATGNCGTLAAGASCSVTVTFSPGPSETTGDVTFAVTSYPGGSPLVTDYSVASTGAYTSESAGLQIVPGDTQYGPQPTGTSGPARQFTVNNLSAKALALEISLPRQYVLAGPACSGLAAGASCVFSVAFLPLTNGTVTGTLFATGTPTDGSATVNGTGYVEGYGNGSGSLTIAGGLLPGAVLDFGQAPSGQSVQRTLTLTNSSAQYGLTVRRITSQPPFAATSTCGDLLAPGASCAVTLSYAPVNEVTAGQQAPYRTDTGTLEIDSDATSSPDSVSLTGTVTPVTVASASAVTLATFTASQNSLTFGSTQAGDASPPQVVTLSNTGTGTVHILGLKSTPDFTATSDCAAIVPGASCTVAVTFTPQTTAQLGGANPQRAGAVEIASDAATPLEFLSAVGTATPSSLTFSQLALDFGQVQVGNKSSLGLQITNAAATAAVFGAVSASGDYAALAGSCPLAGGTLAAGTSCTLQVVFTPAAAGTRTGILSVASSATTLPVPVSLTGVGVQSHLQISPANLDFGPIAVGAAANLSLTLVNTGTAAVTGIALSTTSGYSVSTPCAVTILAPGASCSATVTFAPTKVGSDAGTLTVQSSDAGSPETVLLTGSGISSGSFTLTVDGGASGSSAVKTGRPATFALSVTPVNGFSGTVILNCTPISPADFAYCSLLPSSMTLNGASQAAVATINTVTSIALSARREGRGFGQTALCLLFPALLFSWKARTSSRRVWRRTMPFAWAVFATVALLTSSGCGGSGADPNLRYATPGSYQYQVTASSVGAPVQVTQTVTLNLVITR